MAVRTDTPRAVPVPQTGRRAAVTGRRRPRRAPTDGDGELTEHPLFEERRRVRHVALMSVARVSVLFYLCGFVAFLVAAMVVWIVASAAGVVGEIESFMDDLGFEGFEFVSGTLLWAGLLIGLAVTAILVVLTVFAAALYNLFADLAGGIEVTLGGVDGSMVGGADTDGRRGNGNGARRR